jgi:hypothetical protein
LTDLNEREVKELQLVGLPVLHSHGDYMKKEIGHVVDQWTDSKGAKHVILEITDDLITRSLHEKIPWEVSLKHKVDHTTINPIEISLCKTAFRKGCRVSYLDPDKYKMATQPSEQQAPDTRARVAEFEAALNAAAPQAFASEPLAKAFHAIVADLAATAHTRTEKTQLEAALKTLQGDIDKLKQSTTEEKKAFMQLLKDAFSSSGHEETYKTQSDTLDKIMEAPGGVAAVRAVYEVAASGARSHSREQPSGFSALSAYDNALRGVSRSAPTPATPSDLDQFGKTPSPLWRTAPLAFNPQTRTFGSSAIDGMQLPPTAAFIDGTQHL